ncbi:MAG: prepilin-type N-terminal cleavage/methylation domain-containing protein [Verrucomicrobia bacterium]|nr:prepilin-type N-terminal cleavage/methylation domain-containing protein [Verrucomicrobiota bacterium]
MATCSTGFECGRRDAPACRAFTLLELLVAASITAVLAAFVAVIIGNVATTWKKASGRLGADAQARLILDQLQLDLQGAIFRDDGSATVPFAAEIVDRTSNAGNLWIAAARNPKPTGTGANGSVILNLSNITDCRFGMAGVWLRFFTTRRGGNDATSTATSLNTASAPVAVGYQIIRRYAATNPSNTTSQGYLLHRSMARPSTVSGRPGMLESGYNIRAAAYTTSTSSTNDGSQTGDPRSIQVPGSNTGAGGRNLDSVIADNVIDFGLRCYVRDAAQPGGLRLVFPADATGRPGGTANSRYFPTLPSGTAPTAANYNQIVPDVIDVMVRILTDEGAALIANLERNQTPALVAPQKYNGNAQAWWWGVATENSRVFTRRIVINAKSL